MDEKKRQELVAWRKDRDELMARRKAFYAKLQADCPRIWRTPPERGWYPQPTTPETWDDLIYTLSVKIEELLSTIEEMFPVEEMPYVQQCKEKFGGLRLYISHHPESIEAEMDQLIRNAENASFNICAVCGDTETAQVRLTFPPPNDHYSFGWVNPYCDECYDKKALERAQKSPEKVLRTWYHKTMIARKAARKVEG